MSGSALQRRTNQKCKNEICTPLCGDDSHLFNAQVGKVILSHYLYIFEGCVDVIRRSPRPYLAIAATFGSSVIALVSVQQLRTYIQCNAGSRVNAIYANSSRL